MYRRGAFRTAGAFRTDGSLPYQDDESINPYMHTILCPTDGGAKVPDLDMTASNLKSISITNSFTPAINNATVMIVFFPHNLDINYQIRVYAFDPAVQRFNYLQNILPDEDLSQNFSRVRTISGALAVQSATVSGLTFAIAGTINAVSLNQSIPYRTTTYSALLASKRTAADAVASAPASDGAVVLSPPDSLHEFKSPYTNAVFMNGDKVRALSTCTLGSNGWAQYVNDATPIYTTLGTTMLPDNSFGRFDVYGNVTFTCSGADAIHLTVRVWQIYASTATYVETTNYNDFVYGAQTDGSLLSISFRVVTECVADMYKVELFLTTVGATTPTVQQGANGSTYIVIDALDYNAEGFNDPAGVIALQGLSNEQQIAISGILNYEVVPDYNLAKQMSVTYERMDDETDIQAAEYTLQRLQALGYSFTYTKKAYDALKLTGVFEQMSRRSFANRGFVLETSGIGDFFSGLWAKLKPVLRGLAPIAGTAIGTAFGAPTIGGGIGSAVSSMLTSGSQSHTYLTSGMTSPLGASDGGPSQVTVDVYDTMGHFAYSEQYVYSDVYHTSGDEHCKCTGCHWKDIPVTPQPGQPTMSAFEAMLQQQIRAAKAENDLLRATIESQRATRAEPAVQTTCGAPNANAGRSMPIEKNLRSRTVGPGYSTTGRRSQTQKAIDASYRDFGFVAGVIPRYTHENGDFHVPTEVYKKVMAVPQEDQHRVFRKLEKKAEQRMHEFFGDDLDPATFRDSKKQHVYQTSGRPGLAAPSPARGLIIRTDQLANPNKLFAKGDNMAQQKRDYLVNGKRPDIPEGGFSKAFFPAVSDSRPDAILTMVVTTQSGVPKVATNGAIHHARDRVFFNHQLNSGAVIFIEDTFGPTSQRKIAEIAEYLMVQTNLFVCCLEGEQTDGTSICFAAWAALDQLPSRAIYTGEIIIVGHEGTAVQAISNLQRKYNKAAEFGLPLIYPAVFDGMLLAEVPVDDEGDEILVVSAREMRTRAFEGIPGAYAVTNVDNLAIASGYASFHTTSRAQAELTPSEAKAPSEKRPAPVLVPGFKAHEQPKTKGKEGVRGEVTESMTDHQGNVATLTWSTTDPWSAHKKWFERASVQEEIFTKYQNEGFFGRVEAMVRQAMRAVLALELKQARIAKNDAKSGVKTAPAKAAVASTFAKLVSKKKKPAPAATNAPSQPPPAEDEGDIDMLEF